MSVNKKNGLSKSEKNPEGTLENSPPEADFQSVDLSMGKKLKNIYQKSRKGRMKANGHIMGDRFRISMIPMEL